MSTGWTSLGSRWGERAARLGRSAVDFVYPPVCALCGTDWGGAPEAVPALCPGCRTALTPPAERCCEQCGAPVGPYLPTADCSVCRPEKYRFAGVVRLGVYDGAMRQACLRCKAPGQGALAAALADLLCEVRRGELCRHPCDLVVAVPQHWSQRQWRHPHAAALLAARLARRLKVRYGRNILQKTRRTPAQTELSPTQRRTNLRGAFRAVERRVPDGASVLLVDDVLTTGATANEAARALRRAGAGTVVVAVIGRALGQQS